MADPAARTMVLITYYYPPSSAVGALRAEKVARAFQQRGYRVIVVTERLPGESSRVRLTESGLEVQTVRSIPNPRHWYLALKRLVVGRKPEASSGTADSPEVSVAAPTRVPAWKRYLGSLLWLPDDKQGFALASAWAARRAVREGATLLYSTAPPFSAHLGGLLVKWSGRVRWVVEFRDPWTDNPWKPAHARSRASEAAERWLERRTLAAADYVVGVSEGIRDAMAKKLLPERGARCLVVLNGIPALAPPRPAHTAGPFRITHTGSFYHGRDPLPFLTALAAVLARLRLGPDRVRVDFVGDCRWFDGRSVEAEARALGLDGVMHFQDWVPHAEAQRILEESDLLLLLAQNQPAQVPNKLYEYFGARVPILAYADAGGESARMLQAVGGHYLVTDNDDAAAQVALAAALGGVGAGAVVPDEATLREWTTERQMERLLAAVGG